MSSTWTPEQGSGFVCVCWELISTPALRFAFLSSTSSKTNTQQRIGVEIPDPSEALLLTRPAYLSLGLLGDPLEDVVAGEVRVLRETQLVPQLQLCGDGKKRQSEDCDQSVSTMVLS